MDLQRPEIQDTLDTEITTVDVVTKEEVLGISRIASNLEEFQKIVKLAMNITTYSDRCIYFQKVGFSMEQLRPFPDDKQSLLFG